MAYGRWLTGAAATVVLAATGTWAIAATDADEVDARLWKQVRPAVEARLVADSRGAGALESQHMYRAQWFCRAVPLELEDRDGTVRAGVNALCAEYGVKGGSLVGCTGTRGPAVVRLERDRQAGGGYRVVSHEEPPDGEGYGDWEEDHLGTVGAAGADTPMSSAPLEARARAHFGLPADAPLVDC